MSPRCPSCQSPVVIEGKPTREVVCPTCGSTVPFDPNATIDEVPGDTTLFESPTEIPKALGRFELLERLGAGTFGTVYKARDTELDRLVALKIPRTGSLPNRDDTDRFLREAKSAAQLKHPGIVSLYDAGSLDGTCYLVSEFIPGATLAERLHTRRLSCRQAAEFLAAVADALHYAHENGVVHRDLKPSNIMLDLEDRPHVLDFGLAKRATDEITTTLDGQVLGTPAYMPPEQARGDARSVDARSDIYSLGVILYELLTGEVPFRGQTRMLLVQVIQDEPRPPRRLNDQIPRDLETICLKSMAKEPAHRYSTAHELAADLRRFLKAEPVHARPVGRVETAWRWCRRNPAVAGLTAAAAFLLIAGAAVSTSFAISAMLARDQADANAREALDHAQREASERLRADREADAAWASQYIAHVNRMETDWENANISRIRDTLDVYRQPPPRRKDLRGWEWFFQDRLSSQELHTLRGHSKWVRSVAFSPDGTRLASASLDGTVKMWDVATGRELRTILGHAGPVVNVTFSPDGRQLASASDDQTVKTWDTESGKELATLRGHVGAVWSVAFSPDGTQLASAGSDQTMKLWHPASGKEIRTLRGHASSVWSVAFSPDGTRLASASFDQTVRLWDAASGKVLSTLRGHTGQVWSVAFGPDGTRLASAGIDQTVKLWNANTGDELRSFKGHRGPVWSVAFSPDGARLASASEDQTVKVWDADSGKELRTFKGHTTSVWAVAFGPDGTRLASASFDQTAKVWDTAAAQELPTLRGHTGAVWVVAFSPDGTRLASAGVDQTVNVRDTVTGQELAILRGHTAPIGSVAFGGNGMRLASASWDHTVKVWDADSGRELRTLRSHTGPVVGLAFSPDGAWLASASDDQTVKLWNADTGQELRTFKGHTQTVRSVAFSPDGTWLASGSEDGTVKLWDVGSGRELRSLQGHAGQVVSLALSSDGTWLATASQDRTLKLWDTATGQELRTFTGHTSTVASVAFSPDGTRLVSASRDQTVKLWDAASGLELRTLHGHTDSVWSAAFSPDGARIASGGDDHAVILFDARPVTPEIKAEVEALARLEYFFRRLLPKGEVRAALERDRIIGEAVRRKALELVDRFPEETDPKKLHDAAWPLIRHPHANVFMCQFAMAQMKAACERAPEQESYRIALGIAQYRLGRFQKERYAESLATLTRSEPNQPAAPAFLAMANHQLGHKEEARAALARVKEVIKDERWAKNPDAQSFLREATELIEGQPALPRP